MLFCAIFIFTTVIVIQAGSLSLKQGNGVRLSTFTPPRLNNFSLRLAKNITIESKALDPKWYIFFFHDIAVDSNDNILVLSNNSILKYDKWGKPMGRFPIDRGSGPGEVIQFPKVIYQDSNDNIYLYDGYKIAKFDRGLKFKTNITLTTAGRVLFDKQGNFYAFKIEHSNNHKARRVLSRFSPTGKPVKKINGFIDTSMEYSGNAIYSTLHPYSPNAYFALTSDSLIYGFNMEYTLYKYDLDGKLNAVISIESEPTEITSAEKKKIINPDGDTSKERNQVKSDLKFPDHRPFFKKILTDEKNRIYVIKRKSVLDEDPKAFVDIFSGKGKYLYHTTLPFEPKIILRGYIYGIEIIYDPKEGDYVYRVHKFRIRNYSSMRF